MFEGSVGSPFSGGNHQAAEEQGPVFAPSVAVACFLVSCVVFVEVVMLAGTLQ